MSKGSEKGLTNGEEYSDLVNLLEDSTARARFLVIDDVGKEHSTQSGFSIDTFDLLVRSRYANGFSTTITSNLPLSRWESSYSDSMRDFTERTLRVVHFALMQRGDLAIDNRAAAELVFDGLIANCFRPKAVKWALRRRHWENAL